MPSQQTVHTPAQLRALLGRPISRQNVQNGSALVQSYFTSAPALAAKHSVHSKESSKATKSSVSRKVTTFASLKQAVQGLVGGFKSTPKSASQDLKVKQALNRLGQHQLSSARFKSEQANLRSQLDLAKATPKITFNGQPKLHREKPEMILSKVLCMEDRER